MTIVELSERGYIVYHNTILVRGLGLECNFLRHLVAFPLRDILGKTLEFTVKPPRIFENNYVSI